MVFNHPGLRDSIGIQSIGIQRGLYLDLGDELGGEDQRRHGREHADGWPNDRVPEHVEHLPS